MVSGVSFSRWRGQFYRPVPTFDFSSVIFDRCWPRDVVEKRAFEILSEHTIIVNDILNVFDMLDFVDELAWIDNVIPPWCAN